MFRYWKGRDEHAMLVGFQGNSGYSDTFSHRCTATLGRAVERNCHSALVTDASGCSILSSKKGDGAPTCSTRKASARFELSAGMQRHDRNLRPNTFQRVRMFALIVILPTSPRRGHRMQSPARISPIWLRECQRISAFTLASRTLYELAQDSLLRRRLALCSADTHTHNLFYLAAVPTYLAYLSAQALTPPAFFINLFSAVPRSCLQATYRNARAHLLIVLLSELSSLVHRMMAVNGSAFLPKCNSANPNACRKSFLVFRRTL